MLVIYGAILMMGVPFIGAPNAAIYASKTDRHARGEFMSFLQTTDGCARIVGPIGSTALLHVGGHPALFSSLAGIQLVCLSLFLWQWPRLLVWQDEEPLAPAKPPMVAGHVASAFHGLSPDPHAPVPPHDFESDAP